MDFELPEKKRESLLELFWIFAVGEWVETDQGLIKFFDQLSGLRQIKETPFYIDGDGIGCQVERFHLWKDKGWPSA